MPVWAPPWSGFFSVFFKYILLIMLSQPSQFPPLLPPSAQYPHFLQQSASFSSCPWVVHVSSLASHFLYYSFLFLKYLFLFRERVREGEREGEKHQSVASCMPPTGDLACNPGMCLDQESSQQPFSSQAGAQSTEPHQPGLLYCS